MNIFEEILWPQFVKIEHVSKLPLTEQVAAYQQYIYDLDVARQSWLAYQNKGLFLGQSIQNIGFLAQEEFDSITQDYFTILQEDGSSIFVTALI
jgi:hypothetical protein